jgi:hypothetical protein
VSRSAQRRVLVANAVPGCATAVPRRTVARETAMGGEPRAWPGGDIAYAGRIGCMVGGASKVG